jgi:protein-tyrosine phosphatase
MLDHFRSLGGDPALLHPVVGVLPEYLDAALDEMRTKFGTVEGYFAEGLKIGSAGQDALHDALVVRAT